MHRLVFVLAALALLCCSLEPVFAQERVDPDWPALLLIQPCEGGTLTVAGPVLAAGKLGILSGLRPGDCVRLRRRGDYDGATSHCTALTPGVPQTSGPAIDVLELAAHGVDVSGFGCPVDSAGAPVAAASFSP